ncbi:uncharacterized protein DEA37_0004579 [Paragonimus westermani]|uniref:Reverse transcriptase n=1 Tax=Paragonimus westermani TaxID=34504 RepID=A0A5J4NMH9_9TREM|nr:uncharacterized protein DEA37_0004579 [Paragonimus westermani]
MASNLQPPSLFWNDPAIQPTESAWVQWRTSFTNYLDLLPDTIAYKEEQKLKLLRHLLGDEGQRHFDAFDLQSEETLFRALCKLDQAWGARTNVFTERYEFCQLRQEASEPLEHFVGRLIRSVRLCEYSNIPKNKVEGVMLTQQLIVGVTDQRIRESLLSENSSILSWERATDIARNKAATFDQPKTFFRSKDNFELPKLSRRKSPSPLALVPCYRCGSQRHKADCQTCPARSAECEICGKLGHFARCCPSRRGSQVYADGHISACESEVDTHIFSIANRMPAAPTIMVEPKLPSSDIRTFVFHVHQRKVAISMELDAASPITIIPSSFYDKYLSELPLFPSAYKFDSYISSTVHIRGFIVAEMQWNSKISLVAVYVTLENGRALLGRYAMVALEIIPSIDRMRFMAIDVSSIQSMYPTLFDKGIGRTPLAVHRICLKQGFKPFSIFQPRPVPLIKREAVSAALQEMISTAIIEPTNCSEWVHPMVAALEKDGTVRICNDLKELNRQIVVDKFVLPTMDELLVKLCGARFFSKLDLRKAFFHMSLAPESKPLTAFLTSDGLFQHKVLPVGLSSAPAAWQKFMNHSLADLPGQIVYMEDICVFGATKEERDSRLHKVLQRLTKLDLRLNLQKCKFDAGEVDFLGHIISANGIRPSLENIRAITEAPAPKNTPEVKYFLGMCSYNLRYIPDFSTLAEPLRMLTVGNVSFEWSDLQQTAFEKLKNRIASQPVMAIFDESCPTFVSTDASNIGIGAVLSQFQKGRERMIAYASRKLSPAEKCYSVSEKEALACVWACEKWHLFLFGRPFTIITDHAELITPLSRGTTGLKPLRICRWYTKLLNYDYQIKFRSGAENQMANGLSRLPLNDRDLNEEEEESMMVAAVNSEEIQTGSRTELRETTKEDNTLQKIQQYMSLGWPEQNRLSEELKAFYVLRHELSGADGCNMRG